MYMSGPKQKVKEHLQYANYMIRHKWYVFVECCRLGIPWRGVTHDLSKLLPSEWFPYTATFYGAAPTNAVEKIIHAVKFDTAWLKHIHRNKHHWQYWILHEDCGNLTLIPMPTRYVKEMLADWRGAGKAQGFEDITSWYKKNYYKILIHKKTREYLHSIMKPEEVPTSLPMPPINAEDRKYRMAKMYNVNSDD